MTLASNAAREVAALHAAFEDWFAGRADDAVVDRVAAALAPEFTIVGPDGDQREREPLLESIEAGRGSRAGSEPPFEIEVRAVEPVESAAGRCLVRYEEWQRIDGEWSGRVSSALFRRSADAPEGVEWVHLQETWLDPPG